jgi:pSer/pThr/pTyr-binding forkhead associated (FHA) protein
MKVVVETRNGLRAGHRVWLAVRQQLRVGRSEWAEFAVPDDFMADVQFALVCGGRGCQLRNLAGETPLFVNGRRVEQQTLVSGDLIRAGNTEFLVSIQLAQEEIPSTLPLASRKQGAPLKYSALSDNPSVSCYSGLISETPEDAVARTLQAEHALYLVVHRDLVNETVLADFDRLWPATVVNAGEAEEGQLSKDLCDGLAIVGPTSGIDRFELLKRAWATGGATVLFCAREPDGVLELLHDRPLLRLKPADLVERLTGSGSRLSDDALDSVGALLLPLGKTHWGVFASQRFRLLWERLGLPEAPENQRTSWTKSDSFWMSAAEAEDAGSGPINPNRTLAVG